MWLAWGPGGAPGYWCPAVGCLFTQRLRSGDGHNTFIAIACKKAQSDPEVFGVRMNRAFHVGWPLLAAVLTGENSNIPIFLIISGNYKEQLQTPDTMISRAALILL